MSFNTFVGVKEIESSEAVCVLPIEASFSRTDGEGGGALWLKWEQKDLLKALAINNG
jgi:hypothetical protein